MDESDLQVTAELANIALQADELDRLKKEVDTMVTFFAKMGELDVSNLEPTTHALARGNRVRKDVVVSSDFSDAILEQAPDLEDRFVCIPNVL